MAERCVDANIAKEVSGSGNRTQEDVKMAAAGFLALSALFLLSTCGRDHSTPRETAAAQGAWTKEADGLQFRADTAKLTVGVEEKLSVRITVRNVGKTTRACLDPGKTPGPEASFAFRPCFLKEGKPVGCFESIPLAPVYRPEWYILLKPGQSVTGTLSFHHTIPKGRHAIFLAVGGAAPRKNAELEEWPKEEIERISPFAWRPKPDIILVGPIEITVQ
jgi:hypothetical protein